jgi:hypothetical protein
MLDLKDRRNCYPGNKEELGCLPWARGRYAFEHKMACKSKWLIALLSHEMHIVQKQKLHESTSPMS